VRLAVVVLGPLCVGAEDLFEVDATGAGADGDGDGEDMEAEKVEKRRERRSSVSANRSVVDAGGV